jgi:hypothetical protein
MTEWSRTTAAKIRQRMADHGIRNAKFAMEQRLKAEVGPRLWEDVRNNIEIEASALNGDLSETIVSIEKSTDSELHLIAHLTDGVRRSTVKFEPEAGMLTWKNSKQEGDKCELGVGSDGKMAFHFGMVPSTPESIARQVLNNLLD